MWYRTWFFLILAVSSQSALAQVPPPVDVPVTNIGQQTPVWCWAAVSQQIIAATMGGSPPQCELVETAYGAPSGFCCGGARPECMATGNMSQIAGLISYYGGRSSQYSRPGNPMEVYQTLQQGHPIIAQLATGQMTTHVVVIRGMYFQPWNGTVVPMLVVNDPLAYFTQPVPFPNVAAIWVDALVVY